MQEIQLTQGHVAYVSDEDYANALTLRWYADRIGNTWYAATKVCGKKVYLHRLVVDARLGDIVDHIDCNGLNNMRENLRIVTKSENTMRRGPLTGQYKGVGFERSRNKWTAKHSDDTRGTVNLGRFSTAIEAARAYDTYIRKTFGALAYTNFND